MSKKALLLWILSCSFSVALATDNNIFTGEGDGTLWSDSANWSLGYLPYYNTDHSLYTYIGNGATGDLHVIIDSMVEAGRMWIGRPEDPAGAYRLTLETGSADLYIDRIYIGPKGTLDINDGVFSTREGSYAGGVVNVNNGILEQRTTTWSVGGIVKLNGGTFTVNGSLLNSNILTAGKINLCGGQLVATGNGTAIVSGWISNGSRIIAYNGDTNYMVQATYDSGSNKTTVIATAKVTAENKWTGSGGNNNWADANNWSRGSVPIYNVNNSEYTYIGKEATGDCNVYIYGKAYSGKAWVGRPEDPVGTYILNLQGAEANYYLVRMYVGPKGVLNINGGSFDTWECRFDGAQVNLNSGSLTVRSDWWFFFNGAVVTLNSGTLRIKNGTVFSYGGGQSYNPYFTTGTIDFRGGKLVMDGDYRNVLAWHVNNGNILVFGNTPQGDELDISYDSTANLTTVKVRNDLQAQNTWPKELSTLTVDARRTFQINWKPGSKVENLKGYNVYVDGPLDSDLVLVSSPTEPCTNNFWQITGAALGKSYRWRVDEVLNDDTIIPGEVSAVTINSSELTVYERTVDGVTGPLDYQWIGCGDGSSFNDALNWHTEFTDPNLAIPTYTNHEGDILESRIDGTVIDIDWYSVCGQMYLGYNGLNQTVNLKQGHWQIYRLRCGANATVNIYNRSSAKWIIMESIGGTINLEGYMEIVLKYWSFKKSSGNGGIKLLDGRLLIDTMPISSPFNDGETGNIDIYKGKFVLKGNQLTTVQGWIDSKNIVAYGGTDGNSIVDVYFDSDANQTIATARQDRRLAYEPEPTNNADNVDASKDLSWIVGTGATSDTLYLAAALKADLNKDKTVDVEDLYLLIDNYLDESWLAVKDADITGDGQINMMDFAMMAQEWQNSTNFTQVGTYNHSSGDVRYSTGTTLDYDTAYYWRVDSTVDGVVATGNVWTFTTGSNPLLAYNVWPVNGDENIQRDSGNQVTLTWDTNSLINGCNVYFGDSYGEVLSATTAGTAYKANTASGSWQTSALTIGKTYYWRIDTVQGSTVRKGKVLSFSTTSAPMGLYVANGTLMQDGSQFKGYGVNYIDPFTKLARGASDAEEFEQEFAVLGSKGIPFVRMWGNTYFVCDMQLYFNDKEQYFSYMDRILACAEENNVGVVFSMFWTYYLLPDVVGEHVTSWADPTSKAYAFMENYIREMYDRYKNCPAFWGWELGNEYNLAAEQNARAPIPEVRYGHPQVRDDVLDRINMTWAKQVATNFANAVNKVDKNRIVSNGFSCRYDPSASPAYGQPERYEDHQMADVVSIHYYQSNGTTVDTLSAAVAAATSWGKPLFVGEFGVSEENPTGFPSVQAGFASTLNDMQTAGVTFASMWVYEYDGQNSSWNVSASRPRSYMLDMLSAVNASMND